MYYDQVNDIYLVSKMGQIIKVQRPVSSASISCLYHRPILAACMWYQRPYLQYRCWGYYCTIMGYITVKDHSLLHLTNKDLLMVYVYFLFSFYIKIKRPQVGDRRKPVWFFCPEYIIYYLSLLLLNFWIVFRLYGILCLYNVMWTNRYISISRTVFPGLTFSL